MFSGHSDQFHGWDGKPPASASPNIPNPLTSASLLCQNNEYQANILNHNKRVSEPSVSQYGDNFLNQCSDQLSNWNEWNDESWIPVTPPTVANSGLQPSPLYPEQYPPSISDVRQAQNAYQSESSVSTGMNQMQISGNPSLTEQHQVKPKLSLQQTYEQREQSLDHIENISSGLTDLNITNDSSRTEEVEASYWSDVDDFNHFDRKELNNGYSLSNEVSLSGFQRHIDGQTQQVLASQLDTECPSGRGDGAEEEEGPQPNDERMVPGQVSDEEMSNTASNSSERMITGQISGFNRNLFTSSIDSQANERSRSKWNDSSSSDERLIAGSGAVGGDNLVRNQSSNALTPSSLPLNNRLVPGQGHNCDTPVNMELSFTSEARMIPGHRDDTDPSTSGPSSIAVSRASSEQRLVPGQVTVEPDIRPRPQNTHNDSSSSHSNVDSQRSISNSNSGFERATPAGRNNGEENDNLSPGFQRMVVGQIHQNASNMSSLSTDHIQTNISNNADESGIEQSEMPPPGLHRMVVGEIRLETQPSNSKKESDRVADERNENMDHREQRRDRRNDRDSRNMEDSESDYRKREKSDKLWASEKSRHRRRKDFEKYSDYSSPERNYRRSRDDVYKPRRDDRYHKKRDDRDHKDMYDLSQDESGSDREGDREYQDERRRRRYRRSSPDPYYNYYHEDPRHYSGHSRRSKHYEYDDRFYKGRSRPSSRTESDYRRSFGMYDMRASKPYYAPETLGQPNFSMDPQYLLRLRETDPQKYAQWYAQYQLYVASQYAANAPSQSHPTDRSSVHSGRSSANNGLIKCSKRTLDSCTFDDSVSKAEDIASPRNTPAKFSTAHIKGIMNNHGNLLIVNPSYPLDSHPATIDEYALQSNLSDDPDLISFLQCPGPFTVGTTHKNTVLQYLRTKAEKSNSSAELLLYSLIQLIIRLNGVILGTDVAELLIENYHSSVGTAELDRLDKFRETQETSKLSQAEVTKKFRELLLQGNKGEALEWAMSNNEWGHALLLASKMDTRTYNSVLANFANGLPPNDPLQTLYQLMSGREPQAVTCCGDKRWGDWRPHLAMILSNPSSRTEVDRKAIVTLGDSLSARGRLFAAHFCYLTAQIEFSAYSKPSAKYVLLGSSNSLPFSQFASNSAIMLTACYEFAKKLHNKNFVIPTLQPYKYLLATKLVDWGRPNIALQYLEAVAIEILREPNVYGYHLAVCVLELSERVKHSDLSLSMGGDICDDPDWIVDLRRLVDDTVDGNFRLSERGSTSNLTISDPPDQETVSHSLLSSQQLNMPLAGGAQESIHTDGSQMQLKQSALQQEESKTNFWQPPPSQTYYNETSNNVNASNQQIGSREELVENHWVNSSNLNSAPGESDFKQWPTNANNQWGGMPEGGVPLMTNQQVESSWGAPPVNSNFANSMPISNSQPASFNFYPQTEQHQQQQIFPESEQVSSSLPPRPDYGSNLDSSQSKDQEKSPDKSKDSKIKKSDKKKESTSGGGGWLGGIWDKFARPKNQMKLPDDTNPEIVWDEKKNRWVNRNSDGDEAESEVCKPPPKAVDLTFNPSATSSPSSGPQDNTVISSQPVNTVPSMGNKYKLQRGRGMRSNYVDIMNPGSKKVSQPPQSMMLPAQSQLQPPSVNNFFIPAPVENHESLPVDFISPSGYVSQPVPTSDQPAEMQRNAH